MATQLQLTILLLCQFTCDLSTSEKYLNIQTLPSHRSFQRVYAPPPMDITKRRIELPQQTKTRLGLDDERSWVIVSEANDFAWPGPDLRFLLTSLRRFFHSRSRANDYR